MANIFPTAQNLLPPFGARAAGGMQTGGAVVFVGAGYNTVVSLSMTGAGLYWVSASVMWQVPTGNLSRCRVLADGAAIGVPMEQAVAWSGIVSGSRTGFVSLAGPGAHVFEFQVAQDGVGPALISVFAGAQLAAWRIL